MDVTGQQAFSFPIDCLIDGCCGQISPRDAEPSVAECTGARGHVWLIFDEDEKLLIPANWIFIGNPDLP